MEVIMKNFGLMTLLMMGIIFFYFKKTGMFGTTLIKTVVLHSIEAVVLSIIIISAFTWFWNRAVAVDV